MSEVDVNAIDERSHVLSMVTLAGRYGLAAIIFVTSALAWSCNISQAEIEEIRAKAKQADYFRGKSAGCER